MIGPRDTVVRILRGENVTLMDRITDDSEWIDTTEHPELWVDSVRDACGEDFAEL